MSKVKWHKSEVQILSDGFDTPHEVSDLANVFGGDMSSLLPDWGDIPQPFRSHYGDEESRPWIEWQGDWFFKGVSKDSVKARKDIELDAAFRHLGTIQGSWEPKHEHKAAAVAWLASRWFAAVTK